MIFYIFYVALFMLLASQSAAAHALFAPLFTDSVGGDAIYSVAFFISLFDILLILGILFGAASGLLFHLTLFIPGGGYKAAV